LLPFVEPSDYLSPFPEEVLDPVAMKLDVALGEHVIFLEMEYGSNSGCLGLQISERVGIHPGEVEFDFESYFGCQHHQIDPGISSPVD
jgi:hypothetical protein